MSPDQVFSIAEKYGAFEFGDAQGDKRLAFAADVIAAHQRVRDAAPDLLAALLGLDEAYCRAGTQLTRDERNEDRQRLIAARAAIAKATGAK